MSYGGRCDVHGPHYGEWCDKCLSDMCEDCAHRFLAGDRADLIGCDLCPSPNRHDILDVDDGYIAINRPRSAPPLTGDERKAFEALAQLALAAARVRDGDDA